MAGAGTIRGGDDTPHPPPSGLRRGRPRRETGGPVEAASTRDRILAAAYRTLVELGYGQVSMRRIAVEAGVNQSLLHYYFGTKENLMLEVLTYINDRLIERQHRMYTEAGTFEAIWDKALEYFEEDIRSGFVRALWELWAQGLSNPRIRRRWVEIAVQWRTLVTGLARQGLEEYGLAGRYRPEVLGAVIADLYHGAEVHILSFSENELHVEAIRLMGRLFRLLSLDAQPSASPRKRRDEPATGGS